MKARFSSLLLLLLTPALVSVAYGMSTDQRLEKLERQVGKVSNLTLQMDAMQRENRQLRGEIETLQYQIKQLERKQRDIYLDIDQRLSAMPAGSAATGASAPQEPLAPVAPVTDLSASQPTAPSSQADPKTIQAEYQAAYALLSPGQKRYADAAKAFTAFLEKYPDSPLAANAQYWLAEAYYVSQRNEPALQAFRKVVEQYPSSPKVPGALYKIGRLEQVKGNTAAARQALEKVVAEHPSSPAAGLAKQLLAKIGR